MKSFAFYSTFAAVMLSVAVSFGESCSSGGNSSQGAGYPGGAPYYPPQEQPYYPPQPHTLPPQSGPAARIRVVSVGPEADVAAKKPSRPAAKLTVVADEPQPALVAGKRPETEPAVDTVGSEEQNEESPADRLASDDSEKMSAEEESSIAALTGTWKAVARRGDGELTTIELHLDNRGWAELTVPGSDGKPSTTKSRLRFEEQELKLADADKVVSLGKLVDFNNRQMVLERAEGQVTFVRL